MLTTTPRLLQFATKMTLHQPMEQHALLPSKVTLLMVATSLTQEWQAHQEKTPSLSPNSALPTLIGKLMLSALESTSQLPSPMRETEPPALDLNQSSILIKSFNPFHSLD